MSTKDIRRLSPTEARELASSIAIAFARSNGIEGRLLEVAPDSFETDRRGKTPVHWAAVFDAVSRGVSIDGPVAFRVNLETGIVLLDASP